MRRGRGRGLQSVKKRNLVFGRGCKRQKGGAFPFGLIASAAAPLIGEVAKPIFKRNFGRGRRKRKYRRWSGKQEYYEDVLHREKLHYLAETLLRLDMKEQVDKI